MSFNATAMEPVPWKSVETQVQIRQSAASCAVELQSKASALNVAGACCAPAPWAKVRLASNARHWPTICKIVPKWTSRITLSARVRGQQPDISMAFHESATSANASGWSPSTAGPATRTSSIEQGRTQSCGLGKTLQHLYLGHEEVVVH